MYFLDCLHLHTRLPLEFVNVLHFESKMEHLVVRPIRKIFLCAGCFFRLNGQMKKKQFKHLRVFGTKSHSFRWLVFQKKSK